MSEIIHTVGYKMRGAKQKFNFRKLLPSVKYSARNLILRAVQQYIVGVLQFSVVFALSTSHK